MEFDKSKVFTPFNCGEVKIGSKGYFADYKGDLISRVQSDDKDYYGVLRHIYDDNNDNYAFLADDCERSQYFYLVEEPKKRPCTREELIEMLKKQGLLMLKSSAGNFYYTIKSINDNNVCINENRSYESLCELYTLIDGTELWVEE